MLELDNTNLHDQTHLMHHPHLACTCLPVVCACDFMHGKSGLVHVVLSPGEPGDVRVAAPDEYLAIGVQVQVHAPIVIDEGGGALHEGVDRVVERTGQLLATPAKRPPVQHHGGKLLQLASLEAVLAHRAAAVTVVVWLRGLDVDQVGAFAAHLDHIKALPGEVVAGYERRFLALCGSATPACCGAAQKGEEAEHGELEHAVF